MTLTFLDGVFVGFLLGAAVALLLAVRWLVPRVIGEMFERGWIQPGPTAIAEIEQDERSHPR